MLTDENSKKHEKCKNTPNSPETPKTGLNAYIPPESPKPPENAPGGQNRPVLAVVMPDDLRMFFDSLVNVCPICPNCRRFVELVRVDEQTGAVHCGECDQLLVYPDLAIRRRLLSFLADSGLRSVLDTLNGSQAWRPLTSGNQGDQGMAS